jgi:hypothetical protein
MCQEIVKKTGEIIYNLLNDIQPQRKIKRTALFALLFVIDIGSIFFYLSYWFLKMETLKGN